MVRLDGAQTRSALALYRGSASFFPLIGAVLEGAQDGSVYADDAQRPSQVYVEHAFGFAQMAGARQPHFEAALRRHLLVDKAFAASKVRLYTPLLPDFLAGAAGDPWRSERQRFVLPAGAVSCDADGEFESRAVTASNFDAVEAAFGVARRFWRSREDFIESSLAVAVFHAARPVAICYAAAVCEGRAEVDVLTLPEVRQRGAGRLAVATFVRHCRCRGIEPLWDCFTNNVGSMSLGRAVGFVPSGPSYPFFTIGR